MSPIPARAQERRECQVISVVDGDTFRAACPETVRVRLLLIDSPERGQPPFGAEARKQLAGLLPAGAPVTLELDVRSRDQFGRLLAYAFLPDGRMVNEEMVRSGFAVVLVYPPNVRYVDQMRGAAAESRAARRGLWAVDGFGCDPRDHRRHRC